MKKILPISIACGSGLTILAGYFFQDQLAPVLGLLIHWGISLVGMAGLIGIAYLVKMHFYRIARRQKGSFYSVIVLIAFLLTFVAGLILTPDNPLYRDWVLNIQIPVETSLLAILSVTLLYTSLYLVRSRGWTPISIGFLAGALISLVLNLAVIQFQPGSMGEVWAEFLRKLPLVGIRGILIGMALGGLIVGLRVLLAVDRPYEEE
jgi:hypothetical protein